MTEQKCLPCQNHSYSIATINNPAGEDALIIFRTNVCQAKEGEKCNRCVEACTGTQCPAPLTRRQSVTEKIKTKIKREKTQPLEIVQAPIKPDYKLTELDLKQYFEEADVNKPYRYLMKNTASYHLFASVQDESLTVKPFFVCKNNSFIGWEKSEEQGKSCTRPIISIKTVEDFEEIYEKMVQIYDYFSKNKPEYSGKTDDFLFMNINLEPGYRERDKLISGKYDEETGLYMMMLDCLSNFIKNNCNDANSKVILKGPDGLTQLFNTNRKKGRQTSDEAKAAAAKKKEVLFSLGGENTMTKLAQHYKKFIASEKTIDKTSKITALYDLFNDMLKPGTYYNNNNGKGPIVPYTIMAAILARIGPSNQTAEALNKLSELVPAIFYHKLIEYNLSSDAQNTSPENTNLIKIRLYTANNIPVDIREEDTTVNLNLDLPSVNNNPKVDINTTTDSKNDVNFNDPGIKAPGAPAASVPATSAPAATPANNISATNTDAVNLSVSKDDKEVEF